MARARRPSRGVVKDVGEWRVRSASSTARRGEILGPKCKWGRPERSTPLSPARGSRGILGTQCRCLPFPVETGSVGLCHRRSHRHPVPSDGRSGSEDPFLCRLAVPRPISLAPASNGCIVPAEAFATPPRRKTGQTGRWWFRRRSSQTIPLHPTEAFRKAISKTARTVAAISVGREKLRTFRPLGLSVRWLPFPSDDLKLRLRTESRKHREGSFFHRQAFCLWTRVDNSTVRRDSVKRPNISPIALGKQP